MEKGRDLAVAQSEARDPAVKQRARTLNELAPVNLIWNLICPTAFLPPTPRLPTD